MSKTTNKFSPEVRERAVRVVLDNQGQHGSRWQAVLSISSKIGCAPQTLNDWVNKAEVDSGTRAGVSSEMAGKMKALERENRELRQANEILRKASAYFAMYERQCGTASSTACSGSTADTGHDRLHSLPGSACLHAREGTITGHTWGRADLRGSADRPCQPL